MITSKIITLLKTNAVKQGSIVLVDQGLMSLVTFIAGILIARSSNAHEYAYYMLGWTLLSSMKGIHEALVNLPLTIYMSRIDLDQTNIYRGSVLVHTIIFCFLAGIIMLYIPGIYSGSVSEDYSSVLKLMPLLLVLLISFVVRDFVRNALLARLLIWASVRVNGIASIALISAIFLYSHAKILTPVNAYIIFSITFGISAMVMFWQQRSEYKINVSILWAHFIKNWQLGKWALLGNFAFTGFRQSYPWLILYFLDYKSVAAYYACLALALAPGPLLRGTTAYVLPRMSHGYSSGSTENLIRLLKKSILLLGIPYLVWFFIGTVFGEYVLKLFYIGKYNEYSYLFGLLLTMATIDFVFAPLTSALQVLEKTRAITISLLIGAAVTLSLGPIFIKELGLLGAGLTSVVSMSATIGWRIFVFIKTTSALDARKFN